MTDEDRSTAAQMRGAASVITIALASLMGAGAAKAQEPVAVPHQQEASPAVGENVPSEAITGDIVVTARRRSESLQEVPMTISALSSEGLTNAGVTESRDLGKIVPGLVWKANGQTARNNVFIRGIGNASVSFASSPAVAIYLDDIYLNSQSIQNFGTFDVDRVEVLKGPQGTLYGRNTTGGAVKFVTRKPKVGGDFSGDFEADYGNYNYYKVEAGINIPLGEKAAARISGLRIKRGGMYRDYIVGDRLVDRDLVAVRGQLELQPTDALSINLTGMYGRSTSDNVRYKRTSYADPNSISFDPVTGAAIYGICANPQVGTAPGCTDTPTFTGASEPELNTDIYQTQSNLRRGESLERNRVYGGAATINYDFGPVTLTSVTAYMNNKLSDVQDPDTTRFNLVSIKDTARPRQFSQEVRLSSNGNPDFRWTVGGFYFRERLAATAPVALSVVGFGLGAQYDQVTTGKAVFAEGSYRVTPKLDLTVGLRYSRDAKAIDFHYYNFLPDGRPVISYQDLITDPALGFTPILAVQARDSSNSVSGRISLSYQVYDDILLYASVNRGFKGAEFNVGGDSATSAVFVKPETVDAFELGLKSELFDRKVRFNIAGFHYRYKDKQETVFNTGVATLANAQARVWGVDGELSVRPTSALTLSSNISYVDAKYTDYPNCTARSSSCDNKMLPNAPKFSAQLQAIYDFKIGEHDASIQYSANYRTKTEFHPTNVSWLRQPAYWLMDARASINVTEKIALGAWIKNIANKRYFIDEFDIAAFGYSAGVPGEKRTYGVSVSGSF